MAIGASAKEVLPAVQRASMFQQSCGDLMVGHDVHYISNAVAVESNDDSDYSFRTFFPWMGMSWPAFAGISPFRRRSALPSADCRGGSSVTTPAPRRSPAGSPPSAG